MFWKLSWICPEMFWKCSGTFPEKFDKLSGNFTDCSEFVRKCSECFPDCLRKFPENVRNCSGNVREKYKLDGLCTMIGFSGEASDWFSEGRWPVVRKVFYRRSLYVLCEEHFQKFVGKCPTKFRKKSRNLRNLFANFSGKCSGNVPEMFRKCSGNFPEHFRKIYRLFLFQTKFL